MTNNSKKINVLQVLPALVSGGVERGTIDIAAYLVKNNCNSYVASAGGGLLSALHHEGSTHFTLPLASKNPFTIYRNSLMLIDIINKYNIDIIHARSRAPAWSAYLAAKSTGIKLVTTLHGIYSVKNSLKKFYNSVMVKGDAVIAVSNFALQYIQDNYSIDLNKMNVIHRGVNLDYFDPEKVNEERIINIVRKAHIPMDKPIILLPGRITRWKGHVFLLEALRLLEEKSYFCLIVGDDSGHIAYRRELEALIVDFKLQNNVAIIAAVNDMPALYLLADVVLSTSTLPEAFGRVVTEAQAMGRLVIATNIGGACETIIEDKTGWLVPVKDRQSLAFAIKKALSTGSELRKKQTFFLRQYIKNNFSLELMCDKTMKVYKKLLE